MAFNTVTVKAVTPKWRCKMVHSKVFLSFFALFFFFSGCARWGIVPTYSPQGYLAHTASRKVYVSKISSPKVLANSEVDILGFSIDPSKFLEKDISEYIADGIKREGERADVLISVNNPDEADYTIGGNVKEFGFKMRVEEVPIKGEGYAYYYNVSLHLVYHCIISKKETVILEKDYSSQQEHATIFHYLGRWETLFTEDMNVLVFRTLQNMFEDIEKK